MTRGRPIGWLPLAVLVALQIGYPLTGGRTRADLVIATVVLGFGLSLAHAAHTRGRRAAIALLGAMTAVGGLVEAVGVHTGHPFGGYAYGAALGPRVAGVPVVVPLAWTWLGWPAWLAAVRLTRTTASRIAVATVALASWDLFLDPQMVAAGYWTWTHPRPALPGSPGVPLTNYAGWIAVAATMMALFAVASGPAAGPPVAGPATADRVAAGQIAADRVAADRVGADRVGADRVGADRVGVGRVAARPVAAGRVAAGRVAAGPVALGSLADHDAPMFAVYLWTYAGSVLAHAVFLGLPGSAVWGALGMGLVALPLALSLARGRATVTREVVA